MKKICVGVLVTVTMFFLVACVPGSTLNFRRDMITVYINETYSEKYFAGEFTLQDFGYENAKALHHFYNWSEDLTIFILLEKSGSGHVYNAIKHFNKSKYVKEALKCYYPFSWEELTKEKT